MSILILLRAVQIRQCRNICKAVGTMVTVKTWSFLMARTTVSSRPREPATASMFHSRLPDSLCRMTHAFVCFSLGLVLGQRGINKSRWIVPFNGDQGDRIARRIESTSHSEAHQTEGSCRGHIFIWVTWRKGKLPKLDPSWMYTYIPTGMLFKVHIYVSWPVFHVFSILSCERGLELYMAQLRS